MPVVRRIAVVGCRPPALRRTTPSELSLVEQHAVLRWQRTVMNLVLDDCARFIRSLPTNALIVTGGAFGVDRVAADAGKSRGLEVLELPPDYALFGERATLARNVDIVQAATEVHAWPAPWSRGTWHSVTLAKQLGRPSVVHEPWKAIAGGPGV